MKKTIFLGVLLALGFIFLLNSAPVSAQTTASESIGLSASDRISLQQGLDSLKLVLSQLQVRVSDRSKSFGNREEINENLAGIKSILTSINSTVAALGNSKQIAVTTAPVEQKPVDEKQTANNAIAKNESEPVESASGSSNLLKIILPIALIVIILGVIWFWRSKEDKKPESVPIHQNEDH